MTKDPSAHTFPPPLIWLLVGLTLGWGFNWPMMKLAVTEMAPMRFRTLCLVAGAAGLFAMARAGGLRLGARRPVAAADHHRPLQHLRLEHLRHLRCLPHGVGPGSHPRLHHAGLERAPVRVAAGGAVHPPPRPGRGAGHQRDAVSSRRRDPGGRPLAARRSLHARRRRHMGDGNGDDETLAGGPARQQLHRLADGRRSGPHPGHRARRPSGARSTPSSFPPVRSSASSSISWWRSISATGLGTRSPSSRPWASPASPSMMVPVVGVFSSVVVLGEAPLVRLHGTDPGGGRAGHGHDPAAERAVDYRNGAKGEIPLVW